MSKSKNLANRLQEVLLNGDWIARTNIKEQLNKTNLEEANYKIGNHNSIADLTFHINYYLGGILEVFNGGDLTIRDQFSFDMKPITSERDWQKLKDSFISNAESIVDQIENFPEHKWEEPFVKEIYGTYERNVDGLIEHSYYHFGQISLLLKLIKNALT
jgi:uncharacterized damage-inducible protein DinB